MHRFFVKKEDIIEDKIFIKGQDVHHIERVLRLPLGETISVCDNEGMDYLADIVSIDKEEVFARIKESFRSKGEAPINLKIYQGLPKSDKLELIIQKATELGVKEIVPVQTARCVVKLETGKKLQSKLERWSKIAEGASKQSKRGSVLNIDRVVKFEDALKELEDEELVVVFYESEDEVSFKDVLKGYSGKDISIFIGPEGGLEEKEVEKLAGIGAKVVSLGNRILRTETVSLVASSIIMYELGDLGEI